MRFFFLQEAPPFFEGSWQPPKELSQHLRALRFSEKEEFLLLLPQGGAVGGQWNSAEGLTLLGLREIPRLPLMPITLATAWPKGNHAEDLVRRAAEAGVERIIPLLCEHSVTGKDSIPLGKMRRLEKIVRETCQQCGRPVAPIIQKTPQSLKDVLEGHPKAHPVALTPGAWPLMMELGLHSPKEVLLFVGPEAGFSAEEEDWFQSRNIAKAALLPTVLRIESAGPLAAGLCQHWFFQLSEANP